MTNQKWPEKKARAYVLMRLGRIPAFKPFTRQKVRMGFFELTLVLAKRRNKPLPSRYLYIAWVPHLRSRIQEGANANLSAYWLNKFFKKYLSLGYPTIPQVKRNQLHFFYPELWKTYKKKKKEWQEMKLLE